LSETSHTALISPQVQKVGEVKPMGASSFVVPSYLVIWVFFAAAIGSIDIIQERPNHTLERLLASSVKKESILSGIYLGAVLKGLVQIFIFWTAGIVVFHVDMGVSPGTVLLLSLLVVLMSAAFSVMLATIVKTEIEPSRSLISFPIPSLVLSSTTSPTSKLISTPVPLPHKHAGMHRTTGLDCQPLKNLKVRS
jgi:ABC-type Na+ efflux pump permease subunit